MRNPNLYVGITKAKGRGVFTSKTISENEVIEIAPVIVMSANDRALLDKTLLHDYIFEWQPGDIPQCCMALGYVPIYNHSYQSNCEYFMNYDEQTITIKAVRNIAYGEELTINYNGDWNDEKPVWFDASEK
ncbi:MAG: SET domain-containing protein-lysine N-methyltransferase [Bacteroidetes bacterium]|nr:SET domain-containing protein-lysine N-methyltransferase [Bacteroidota bacterium]